MRAYTHFSSTCAIDCYLFISLASGYYFFVRVFRSSRWIYVLWGEDTFGGRGDRAER